MKKAYAYVILFSCISATLSWDWWDWPWQHTEEKLQKIEEQYMQSVEDWEWRANDVRKGMLSGSLLDPLPDKTDLNVNMTSRRYHDGYTVQNIYFEALPTFFVTGNLFRPILNDTQGPVPAFLHPHGHFDEKGWYARTRPDNQALSASLAKMGAVVFAYDMVGWGDSRQFKHTQSNVLQLQLWDSIRVIDFLLTLPEVDPSRIGVVGASGGGTQTFLVAAVDPRIAMSIPVVMVSAAYTGDDPCEDGMEIRQPPNGLATNNAEITGVVAPKPLLVISDGEDWTQKFPIREKYFIDHIYALYFNDSSEAPFQNVHLGDEGHDFGINKRLAVYSFVSKYWGLPQLDIDTSSGNPQPEPVDIEPQEDLVIFPSDYPIPSANVDLMNTYLNGGMYYKKP